MVKSGKTNQEDALLCYKRLENAFFGKSTQKIDQKMGKNDDFSVKMTLLFRCFLTNFGLFCYYPLFGY